MYPEGSSSSSGFEFFGNIYDLILGFDLGFIDHFQTRCPSSIRRLPNKSDRRVLARESLRGCGKPEGC